MVEAAYRDGVRAFVEVGPGNSCTRMIDAILGDRPHFARAAHAAKQDAVSQMLRLVAHLLAERLPVDLAALYGTETKCVGHREPEEVRRNEVAIPVGMRPPSREAVVVTPSSRDRKGAERSREVERSARSLPVAARCGRRLGQCGAARRRE